MFATGPFRLCQFFSSQVGALWHCVVRSHLAVSQHHTLLQNPDPYNQTTHFLLLHTPLGPHGLSMGLLAFMDVVLFKAALAPAEGSHDVTRKHIQYIFQHNHDRCTLAYTTTVRPHWFGCVVSARRVQTKYLHSAGCDMTGMNCMCSRMPTL